MLLFCVLRCGKQLKELSLSWCWLITDTGLVSIVDHCWLVYCLYKPTRVFVSPEKSTYRDYFHRRWWHRRRRCHHRWRLDFLVRSITFVTVGPNHSKLGMHVSVQCQATHLFQWNKISSFLLCSCSQIKAISPKKISLRSCNFPPKWNLSL